MKIWVRATVRCACWAVAIVLWPALGRAAGDEPTYALSWSRADGARDCINSSALANAVEARLGRSVFVSPAAAEFTLEARIEGRPAMWAASISLQDRDGHRIGQRDLTSNERDCRALDQSLSLMLALAIDPNATLAVAGSPAEPRVRAAPIAAPVENLPSLGWERADGYRRRARAPMVVSSFLSSRPRSGCAGARRHPRRFSCCALVRKRACSRRLARFPESAYLRRIDAVLRSAKSRDSN